MTPLIWIPGHMCGRWLYAPVEGAWPGEERLADVTRDDSLAAMAERLLADGPERMVLAGLSMGAMVAMEAMARAPDRIAGALLMATDPTPAPEAEIAWRARRMAEMGEDDPSAYVARFVARFYAHDAIAEVRFGAETRARMAETPAGVIARQARALDSRRAMVERLAGFPAPVEVRAGAEDRVCPAHLHRPLAEALGDAVLTELPGTGHILTLEAPEAVRDRLAALSERIGAGR